MSHFAVYECNVSRPDFIKKSLKDMGLDYQENVTIVDWANQKRKATIAVVKDGILLPLGWIENENKKLELQADWFEVPFSEEYFVNEIAQHHSKYQVLEACEENNWDVDMDSIQFNEKGELEILATQFA